MTAERRVLRPLASSAIAAIGIFALVWAAQPRPDPARGAVALTLGAPRSFAEALARSDADLAANLERARTRDEEWLVLEQLASAWLARARLTGSFDDYAEAQRALDRAFAVAPPGTGPHMTQAVLDFTMHRLARAEAQLARIGDYAVPPDAGDRSDIAAISGDIAFYRGDYRAGLAGYERAAAIEPAPGIDFRRAVYHARTGRFDLAERYFDRAEASARWPTPQFRSSIALQRGALDLDRGRHASALAHFRRADAIFPGHWLIEEHIAETLALTGDASGAATLYEDIVRRTGHPEFMDALADIEEKRGNEARAKVWTRRARKAWRQRLALFPEAAYGHALAHYLEHGDPAETLAMAERNHAARPHGDAQILLAESQLKAGRIDDATATVDALLASSWRTADVPRVAALVDEAAGTPPVSHPILSGR